MYKPTSFVTDITFRVSNLPVPLIWWSVLPSDPSARYLQLLLRSSHAKPGKSGSAHWSSWGFLGFQKILLPTLSSQYLKAAKLLLNFLGAFFLLYLQVVISINQYPAQHLIKFGYYTTKYTPILCQRNKSSNNILTCVWVFGNQSFLLTTLCTSDQISPRGWTVKPDILISIHGSYPGSFLHFWNSENILDGFYDHVHGSSGSYMNYCVLYSHATR